MQGPNDTKTFGISAKGTKLIMTNLKIIGFIVLFSFQLLGCSRSAPAAYQVNPLNLSTLKASGQHAIDKELQRKIEASLKYKNYDLEKQCFVNVTPNFCVKITSAVQNTENKKEYLYVVESAYPLDADNELDESHAAGGALKFLKYELNNNQISLAATSDPFFCGPYGKPCDTVTFKFGDSEELAWKTETGDMHQGYGGTSMQIYALIDRHIQQVLNVQTSYTNSGAILNDDPQTEAIEIDSTMTTVPQKDSKFFDLEMTLKGEIKKNKKTTPVNSKILIKFDIKKNAYDTQLVQKEFKDGDY